MITNLQINDDGNLYVEYTFGLTTACIEIKLLHTQLHEVVGVTFLHRYNRKKLKKEDYSSELDVHIIPFLDLNNCETDIIKIEN